MLEGKPGKVGHATGVRVVPGPFFEGAGLRGGRIHLDFKVTSTTAKGSVTQFFQGPGATFQVPGDGPVSIRIVRVGYTDGTHAVRIGENQWKITTPKGTTMKMDTEALLQLGEQPTKGLKMPKAE